MQMQRLDLKQVMKGPTTERRVAIVNSPLPLRPQQGWQTACKAGWYRDDPPPNDPKDNDYVVVWQIPQVSDILIAQGPSVVAALRLLALRERTRSAELAIKHAPGYLAVNFGDHGPLYSWGLQVFWRPKQPLPIEPSWLLNTSANLALSY